MTKKLAFASFPFTMSAAELFSLRELFARVAPYVPPLLVPKDNLERISEFVDLLPESIPLKGFCFESLMNRSTHRSDFSFCIDLHELDGERLKHSFKIDSLPESSRDSTAWKQLSSLVERGVDGGFFNSKTLGFLWLEFDIGSEESWPPPPNLFLNAAHNIKPEAFLLSLRFLENKKIMNRPSAQSQSFRTGSSRDSYRPVSLMYEESPFLRKEFFKKVEELFSCAESHHLCPRFVGWMLGRGNERIKVGFHQFSHTTFERFLREISYSHPIEPLIELIDKISPGVEKMLIHIDVSEEGLGPKIGIECFNWADYRSMLSRFTGEQLITPEEESALISWVGGKRYIHESQCYESYHLVDHLKIIYHPEKPLQTKAYFASYWHKESIIEETHWNFA